LESRFSDTQIVVPVTDLAFVSQLIVQQAATPI